MHSKVFWFSLNLENEEELDSTCMIDLLLQNKWFHLCINFMIFFSFFFFQNGLKTSLKSYGNYLFY